MKVMNWGIGFIKWYIPKDVNLNEEISLDMLIPRIEHVWHSDINLLVLTNYIYAQYYGYGHQIKDTHPIPLVYYTMLHVKWEAMADQSLFEQMLLNVYGKQTYLPARLFPWRPVITPLTKIQEAIKVIKPLMKLDNGDETVYLLKPKLPLKAMMKNDNWKKTVALDSMNMLLPFVRALDYGMYIEDNLVSVAMFNMPSITKKLIGDKLKSLIYDFSYRDKIMNILKPYDKQLLNNLYKELFDTATQHILQHTVEPPWHVSIGLQNVIKHDMPKDSTLHTVSAPVRIQTSMFRKRTGGTNVRRRHHA